MDYDESVSLGADSQKNQVQLKDVLQSALDTETEMMRTYMITAERVHENDTLKDRLRNFAEGNAKRSRQLQDELSQLQ